jgi:hypothetical protein
MGVQALIELLPVEKLAEARRLIVGLLEVVACDEKRLEENK